MALLFRFTAQTLYAFHFYMHTPNRYILLVFIVMRKWRLIWRVIYDVIR